MSPVERYVCPCTRPLDPEMVVAVLPGGWAMGGSTVLVSYYCVCSVRMGRRVRRYFRFPEALRSLVGEHGLPWRNPMPVQPVDEEHADLKAWRNLLDWYGDDSDEFINALSKG